MNEKMKIILGIIIVVLLMVNCANALNITVSKKKCEDIQNNNTSKILTLSGNSPNIEWEKTYYSSYNENGISIDQTIDKGFIVAVSRTDNEENKQVAILKIDKNGNKKWNKTIGEGVPKTVQQTSDGGFAILSTKMVESTGKMESKLTKLNSNGNIVWSEAYGSGFDSLNEAWATNDNRFILVGSKMNNMIHTDFWLIKANSNGGKIWYETYDNSGLVQKYSDIGNSVDQLDNDGFIIAGSSMKIAVSYQSDAWLIKTDSQAQKVKENTFGGPFSNYMWFANSVKEDRNGDIIVAGSRNKKSDIDGSCYWMLKTDSDLNKLKEYYVGTVKEENELFKCVRPTIDGGYIAIGQGYTINPPEISSYSRLIKLNTNLNIEWYIDYNNIYNAAEQTSDGGYIICGGVDGNINIIKFETNNHPPNKPDKPSGCTSGVSGKKYDYKTSTTDPEGENIYYYWDWGDGSNSKWLGPYQSGQEVTESHKWDSQGDFQIRVKAKDVNNAESDWSKLSVSIPKLKYKNIIKYSFWEKLLNIYFKKFTFFQIL